MPAYFGGTTTAPSRAATTAEIAQIISKTAIAKLYILRL